jgi:cytoskeleton protein RodZ
MTDPNAEQHVEPEAATAESAAAPAESPGALLLAERRNQGLSLGDIARQLKLSVRQVEALERDDYATFSGPLFVRGFLRNYAKLLHLEPEALLAAANLATPAVAGPTVTAHEPVSAANPEGRRRFVAWSVTVVLVIIVLMLLASNVSKNRREPAPSPVAQGPSAPVTTPQHADSPPATLSPAPSAAAVEPAPKAAALPEPPVQAPESKPPAMSTVPAPGPAASTASTAAASTAPATVVPEPPAAAPMAPALPATAPKPHVLVSGSGTSLIHLSFEGESWVEIKDGSGTTIFSRLNAAGTERVVKGTPPLTLVVGNARDVKLIYRDKAIDLGPHTRVDVARVTLE